MPRYPRLVLDSDPPRHGAESSLVSRLLALSPNQESKGGSWQAVDSAQISKSVGVIKDQVDLVPLLH